MHQDTTRGLDQAPTTERDLHAAQGGDEVAFTRLFRAVQPAVLRYLQALAGPAGEDLAAETWLQVVRGLRGFSGDLEGFRAWVFTIAHHRYVDHVRRLGRQAQQVDDAALETRAAPRQVEDEVGEVLSTEQALRLIARLPRDQAQVVLLRVVAGLDVPGTARVLGKRPGTVRVLAHRGLRRLARLVADGPVTQLTAGPAGGAVTESARSAVTGES